jgi:arylsulfatase A-like enzyme
MSSSARARVGRSVLAAALLALGACGDAGKGGVPRNVLLITLDTTRADHISCYGEARAQTPALDQLAAAGTAFDLALATASVTPVSHASILTGLANHEHGLRVLFAGSGYRLPEGVATLATVLAEHGFETKAVHSAFPVSRFFGLERGFASFDDLVTALEPKDGQYRWDVAGHQRRSDETTERAIAALGPERFFLWVHYWDPHDLGRLPPGYTQKDARALQEAMPQVQPLYAEEVAYMDSQLARLFAALRERGLEDETLVIVVADHGQGLMDHDWPSHRLLYQEQIRVPLIVRVPGRTQVPVVPQLVRTTDLYPTVLELLGLEPPRPVSGRSLVPLLEGRADAPRIAFADQINGYDWNTGMGRHRPLDDFLYSVVEREWKLIYRPRHFEKSELFHLASDPREARNLFAERRDEARRLLALLAAEAPWVVGPFETLEHGGSGADVQGLLSQLGYTGSEPVEAEWQWTCPAHLEWRADARGACPSCGGAPLLVGR